MTAFAVRLGDLAAQYKQRGDDLVRNVVTDIARAICDRSPIGDPTLWKHPAPKDYKPGRFLGNWQLGMNFQPAGETGQLVTDRGAQLATLVGQIGDHPAGTIIYLQNNSPYARPLEDGHSTQAPTGIVGLTAIEFQQIVNSQAMLLVA